MAEIQLPNNFYIDRKPNYYRLCERYQGKTKTGEPREGTRRYGSHRELSGALAEFLERNTLNGAEAVSIYEVGKLVERSNKMAVYKLEQIVRAMGREKVERNDI